MEFILNTKLSTLTSDRKKTIDKNRKHAGVLQNLVEERKRKEEQKKRLGESWVVYQII